MAEAHDLGLVSKDSPHRAFIGFQLDAKVRRDNYVRKTELFFSAYAYPPGEVMYRAMRAARSLLIISAAEPRNNVNYRRFQNELVRRTKEVPPFNDTNIYHYEWVRMGLGPVGGEECMDELIHSYSKFLRPIRQALRPGV
jgi:hypothetical protein